MNFSIGKLISGVKNGIGAIVNGNFPVVDVYQRPYSNPYSQNIVIPITSATQRTYQIPDLDFFRDKLIIGIATRAQNTDDNKYSKNGRKLITPAALNCAFLRLSQNNLQVQENLPLAFLVHEHTGGSANTYAQVMLEQGLTPQSSMIEFSQDPAGNAGRDVELIVYFVPLSAACYQ